MNSRRLFAACVVMWVTCFVWSIIAPSWWATALSVPPAFVGAVLALGWLSFARGSRAHARQAAEEQSLLVDREVSASLTDETLAWAVGTWRRRYL